MEAYDLRPPAGRATRKLACSRGRLFAAGAGPDDGFVAGLAADGTLAWRTLVGTPVGSATALAVARNGTVVAAFVAPQAGPGSGIASNGVVVGVAERRGRIRWRRILDGDAPVEDPDVVRDLVVTPRGDAAGVALTTTVATGRDFVAFAVRARSGRHRGKSPAITNLCVPPGAKKRTRC